MFFKDDRTRSGSPHGGMSRGLGAAASLLLLCHGAQATAQVEEIQITAQKRVQAAQDVGISVTAMSGDQLEELGATSTTDIVQQVPALRLTTFTPAFTIFSLRGISQNNFQDNLEAPVAVYMDDAYVASMNAIGAQMFDMSRVEVLRGPQGTLFGRNTTGGLIHFVSRGADEQELNGYAEASYSDFDKRSVEGAIGGGSERVRGRFAGRWEEADGYVKSVTPGIRDAHGANGYALRGDLQVDFSDAFTGDFRVRYAKDDDVPSGAYTVAFATFDPQTGFGIPLGETLTGPLEHASTLQGGFDRDTKSVTGTLRWKLGDDVELTSISNYLDLHKDYLEDAGGGFGFFPYHTIADFDQFSEELRLSGEGERSHWQVGAYYLDMKWDLLQSVAGALILGGTSDSQMLSTPATIDSKNWSLFAQGEYDLRPDLTLIAGLRWSQDDKHLEMSRIYEDIPNGVNPEEVFNIDDVDIPGIDDIDYGDYAARLQLNFTPAEHTLYYASINRGIKGGNWSLDPLGAVANSSLKHNEEVLLAYELGAKHTFGNGLANLSASVFYYDYDGYQAFSLVNLTPQVTNSDASAHGGELELALAPAEGWNFGVGLALLDSKVDAVPDVFGGTVEAEFPLAPSVSFNVLGRYEWSVMQGRMSAQIDGVYNGDQFLEGTNSQVSAEDAYSVWNARLDYTTASGRWNFALWEKNFTDTRYRLYDLDLGLLGFIEQVYAPPRWLGATVSYHWE
jgi:iron complex outermembrane receptor protein